MICWSGQIESRRVFRHARDKRGHDEWAGSGRTASSLDHRPDEIPGGLAR
jgi:hypothetical protein